MYAVNQEQLLTPPVAKLIFEVIHLYLMIIKHWCHFYLKETTNHQ